MTFKKGESGNPSGRPKGAKDKSKRRFTLGHFMDAIEKVEEELGINYYEKIIEMSLDNAKLAAAVLKKLIPDQTGIQIMDLDNADEHFKTIADAIALADTNPNKVLP